MGVGLFVVVRSLLSAVLACMRVAARFPIGLALSTLLTARLAVSSFHPAYICRLSILMLLTAVGSEKVQQHHC